MKIYVASPYQAVIDANGNDCDISRINNQAIKQCMDFFAGKKISIFSPIVEFAKKHKDKPRDEVMQICFKALKKCDCIFIPDVPFVEKSQGIKDEINYAERNGLSLVFYGSNAK